LSLSDRDSCVWPLNKEHPLQKPSQNKRQKWRPGFSNQSSTQGLRWITRPPVETNDFRQRSNSDSLSIDQVIGLFKLHIEGVEASMIIPASSVCDGNTLCH